jgi:hypothetical protein
MLKRLFAALLLGGLLLGLTPTAAGAYDYRDDHYRCMYHCDERYGYGRRDGYDRSRYGYRSDRYRRDHYYQDGGCWYHDGWGWHRCRSGYGYGYGYGYGSSGGGDPYSHDSGGSGSDSGPGTGRSDDHRYHPRG